MTERQTTTWNRTADAILAAALGLSVAIGGYYVNQMDQRNSDQDKQIDDHAYRIRGNEKDLEYAKEQLRKIDTIDKKLDVLIQEARK